MDTNPTNQEPCCCCEGGKSEETRAPCCHQVFPEEILNYIHECLQHPHSESFLIPILNKIQQHFGYLTPEYLDEVAHLMHIPSAKISGVATFYHLFTFVPRGKNRISVCLGTACYVKGAAKLLERLEDLLKIKEGQVTPDGQFSIDMARCVGACALAPVIIVNDRVYSEVKPDQVEKILQDHGFQK